MNTVQEMIEKRILEELDLDKIVDELLPEIGVELQKSMKQGFQAAMNQYIQNLDIPYLMARTDMEDIIYDKMAERLTYAFEKAFDIMDGEDPNEEVE